MRVLRPVNTAVFLPGTPGLEQVWVPPAGVSLILVTMCGGGGGGAGGSAPGGGGSGYAGGGGAAGEWLRRVPFGVSLPLGLKYSFGQGGPGGPGYAVPPIEPQNGRPGGPSYILQEGDLVDATSILSVGGGWGAFAFTNGQMALGIGAAGPAGGGGGSHSSATDGTGVGGHGLASGGNGFSSPEIRSMALPEKRLQGRWAGVATPYSWVGAPGGYGLGWSSTAPVANQFANQVGSGGGGTIAGGRGGQGQVGGGAGGGGGAGPFGKGGAGGLGIPAPAAGQHATGNGCGGGGGGCDNDNLAYFGGNGSPGFIMVEYWDEALA